MESLLEKALPSPQYIKPASSGAVVALAAHSLMVEAGFRLRGQQEGDAAATPPADWNGKFQDEWVFEYARAGCANTFVLHLSLQSATGRMFVQASEANNLNNIQNLGLVPSNYVSDASQLEAATWAGLVQNEGQLRSFVTDHISRPLAAEAAPALPNSPTAASAAAASAADGSASAPGIVTAAASRGIVRPDGEALSGLRQPVVLASVAMAIAAATVAWIAWSRSGRA